MTVQRPIRRRLMGTHTMSLRRPEAAKAAGSGTVTIIAGFAIVLALGTAMLMMPFSTESGDWADPYDAFFTAVSAICVTGLVVVETQEHWSFWGELWILLLIQVGGLGYMVGASLFLWAIGGRRLGIRDQYMLRLYYGAPTMAESVVFARRIAIFVVGFEATGAALLWLAFVLAGVSPMESIWWGIFHSISAFNNAGFAVTGVDMIGYQTDPFILLTIAVLVIAGGIGAIPVLAIWQRKSLRRMNLDARLIIYTSAVLLVAGTAFILFVEWENDATLGAVSPGYRPLIAFFQAVVPRTAGFSAVDIAAYNDESKFFTVGLMFIGGAAGSTAGGIKVGTFSLLFVAMLAALRGRQNVSAFGRAVPHSVILQAMTIALLGVAALFALTMLLLSSGNFSGLDSLVEVGSALGTVGLSTGITPEADWFGRAVLITGMLVGRFGPLILVLEMTRPRARSTYQLPEDSIRIG